ncbi:MAG: FAD-dependent oxidoreductase, partial [Pseudomonadota bacterium]
MPAGPEEVEDAEREGVKMMYLTSPVEFMGEGKVRSVKFVKMELGEPDASGRRRPMPIENSEFELQADTVISAIGYIPDAETLIHNGLNINKKGTVIVQDDTGITNIKGIFAGGDVVTGPLSVIEAMASGRRAAEAIHRHFRNQTGQELANVVALRSLDEDVVKLINKSERQKMPDLPVEERSDNFREVDLGYSREQACKEALRCLNCAAGASVAETCAACLNCVRICPFGVPVPGKEIAEIDISQCQACGICASECPASAITLQSDGKADFRQELDQVIDFARQETPDILVIGFYCRYASPIGPPFDRGELYWIARCCMGGLKELQLLYPFETGVEGVLVHACRKDECRFRDGGRWLLEHIKRAKRILKETALGEDRLSLVLGEEEFTSFRERLDTLGINPLREGKKVGP